MVCILREVGRAEDISKIEQFCKKYIKVYL